MSENDFQKKFGSEKFWSEKKFCLKKIWSKIFSGSNKISGLKTLGPNKILCLEKDLSKNILVHKNYDPNRLGEKFGQNQTRNS